MATGSGDQDLAIFDGKVAWNHSNTAPGNYRVPRVSPDGKAITFESGNVKRDPMGVAAMRLPAPVALRFPNRLYAPKDA